MKVTDRKGGKSTRFVLDESGEMRFVPEKQSGGKREVVLKMSMDEGPAEKLEGIYTFDGKQIHVTLRKIE